MAVSGFDMEAPRWDQSTFSGRLRHFFNITDWRTALLPDARLDEAKALVEGCRYTHRERHKHTHTNTHMHSTEYFLISLALINDANFFFKPFIKHKKVSS